MWVHRQQVLEPLLEPAAVIHQVEQRDRPGPRRRHLEVEIVIDIAIEIELALLHQLHDRRPGKELRGRADAGHHPLRIHGAPLLHIGIAIARLIENLAILHDRYHGARDVAAFQPIRQQPVQPRLRIRRGQLVPRVLFRAGSDARQRRGGRPRRRRADADEAPTAKKPTAAAITAATRPALIGFTVPPIRRPRSTPCRRHTSCPASGPSPEISAHPSPPHRTAARSRTPAPSPSSSPPCCRP